MPDRSEGVTLFTKALIFVNSYSPSYYSQNNGIVWRGQSIRGLVVPIHLRYLFGTRLDTVTVAMEVTELEYSCLYRLV